jgi:hypothetical protein
VAVNAAAGPASVPVRCSATTVRLAVESYAHRLDPEHEIPGALLQWLRGPRGYITRVVARRPVWITNRVPERS